MEDEEKKRLRKLIREILSHQKSLIQETIPDEAFSDSLPLDLKAWLFFYKHYSQIAEETIGKILSTVLNHQIGDVDKFDEILAEWKIYQSKIASLPTPSLN